MSDAFRKILDEALSGPQWELFPGARELAQKMIERMEAEPQPLVWSTERPTVPGWYWIEVQGAFRPDEGPMHVFEADGVLWQDYDPDTDLIGFVNDRLNLVRWAGPIPVPEEPT